MAINRTAFNALIDDDGSNTIGTPWNKAQIDAVLMDPTDAELARLATNLRRWPRGTAQVVFNDAGVLAGNGDLTFNKSVGTLTVGGEAVVGGLTFSAFTIVRQATTDGADTAGPISRAGGSTPARGAALLVSAMSRRRPGHRCLGGERRGGGVSCPEERRGDGAEPGGHRRRADGQRPSVGRGRVLHDGVVDHCLCRQCADCDGDRIYRATSSRRYKTAIEPLRDWRWFLDLDAVEFADGHHPEGRKCAGFTAEDVALKGPAAERAADVCGPHAGGRTRRCRPTRNLTAVIQLALKDVGPPPRGLERRHADERSVTCRCSSRRDPDFLTRLSYLLVQQARVVREEPPTTPGPRPARQLRHVRDQQPARADAGPPP